MPAEEGCRENLGTWKVDGCVITDLPKLRNSIPKLLEGVEPARVNLFTSQTPERL